MLLLTTSNDEYFCDINFTEVWSIFVLALESLLGFCRCKPLSNFTITQGDLSQN